MNDATNSNLHPKIIKVSE